MSLVALQCILKHEGCTVLADMFVTHNDLQRGFIGICHMCWMPLLDAETLQERTGNTAPSLASSVHRICIKFTMIRKLYIAFLY